MYADGRRFVLLSESTRSILTGQTALYVLMLVALVLTAGRRISATAPELRELSRAFLLGLACQCVHLIEEFLTAFHRELPRFLRLADWSAEFFITFNVAWLAVWLLAAAGIELRLRAAFFPLWFFALGMTGNAVWHPLLAAAKGGYFPGLYTSPLVGVAGVILLRRTWRATGGATAAAPPPEWCP